MPHQSTGSSAGSRVAKGRPSDTTYNYIRPRYSSPGPSRFCWGPSKMPGLTSWPRRPSAEDIGALSQHAPELAAQPTRPLALINIYSLVPVAGCLAARLLLLMTIGEMSTPGALPTDTRKEMTSGTWKSRFP
ncbi:hypothetical protein NDU88_005062 [Pleurodeles waltl]|uniref:Uncharacterized protein n=1 Tax=Pleurodeles waltl TaxID=8319 RepID=A0AAV7VMG3_PLEWA|nr:hypothetical protein NDU88_005062 [Pleurodeles waltl]